MPEPTITVVGYGTARARPSGLGLMLIVRATSESPRDALDEAARRSHALEEVLRERGISETSWTTIATSLVAQRRWLEPQREDVLIGYMAAAGLAVDLEDVEQTGAVMADAADRA